MNLTHVSLRSLMPALVIFFGLVFLGWNGWRTLRGYERVTRDTGLRDTEKRAIHVAGMAEHFSRLGDSEGLLRELSYAPIPSAFQLGMICDEGGEVLHSSRAEWLGLNLSRTPLADAAKEIPAAASKVGFAGASDRIVAVSPFDSGQGGRRWVVLGHDLSNEAAASQAAAWRTISHEALAVVACGSLLGLALHGTVGQRVRWLAEEVRRLGRGEEPRPPMAGGDELSALSRCLRDTALELRASTKRVVNLEKALDEHAIVAITDRAGRITHANDKFCEISQYSRDELLGQDHRIINSGFHPKEFIRGLWEDIRAGKVWHGEIKNRAKDGGHYWVATTIVPFLDSAGKPEEFVAIRTDITAWKAAEVRLQDLARDLEAKNKELESILYVASHDLRSPLVNVQGFAGVIDEQVRDFQRLVDQFSRGELPSPEQLALLVTETTDALRFITAGAVKMDGLLKGLLEISRLGRAAMEPRTVDMNALVAACLDAMKFQLDAGQAEVVTADLPPCRADEALLGQVFSNLLENAVKYRDPSRRLRIGVAGARDNGTVSYTVSDNGRGIGPGHHEKVFDLFHRLTPTEGDGQGIGLTIVRRALDRMGGQVSLSSDGVKGSRFTITLPAA